MSWGGVVKTLIELGARARLAKKRSTLEEDDLSEPGGLECICFNARSVTGNLDVVAVTETWLKEGQDWQLNIPGYKCFRRDRGGVKKGGE